jgi:hypothetical protein
MTMLVAYAVVLVLVVLSLLHVAWAFGWRSGFDAAIPEVAGKKTLNPSRAMTLGVAALLAIAATIVAMRGDIVAAPSSWTARVGTWAIAFVFAARAIGEGRTVGLFKRVRGTRFARWDTWLYSPLCAALAIGCGIVAIG